MGIEIYITLEFCYFKKQRLFFSSLLFNFATISCYPITVQLKYKI